MLRCWTERTRRAYFSVVPLMQGPPFRLRFDATAHRRCTEDLSLVNYIDPIIGMHGPPSTSSYCRFPSRPSLQPRMLSCVNWTHVKERKWFRYCQIFPVCTSGAQSIGALACCAMIVVAVVVLECTLEMAGRVRARSRETRETRAAFIHSPSHR